jgi:hypothetical protein
MKFFSSSEFQEKYNQSISEFEIESACEMIYAQISQLMREEWNESNVPERIKSASMEQARFLLEQDIPHVDTKKLKAGEMEAELQSEYSTLALTMLSNGGYLYRGNPINHNMGLNISWSE